MNQCNNYSIPCPFALSLGDQSGLPCIGTQEQCDAWREKYRNESSRGVSIKESVEKLNMGYEIK